MSLAETILEAIEPLDHVGRVRAMLALGRRAAAEPEVRAAIAELSAGDFMGRYLALHTCFMSRDPALVMRGLADPSRIVRGLALRLAPLVFSADELVAAFAGIAPQVRIAFLVHMRKQHLMAAIDAVLATPAAQSDPQFLQLLTFGSENALRPYRDRFLAQSNAAVWLALAHNHPVLALAWISDYARAAGFDGPTRHLASQLVQRLPASLAADVAPLLLAYAQTDLIRLQGLQPLVPRFPRAVAAAVLAQTRQSYVNLKLSGVVGRLTTEQIIALAQNYPGTLSYGYSGLSLEWLSALPAESRVRVYEAVKHKVNQPMSVAALAALPGEWRVREARRYFDTTEIKQTQTQRLPYAMFFAWDDLLATVAEPLHAAEANTREAALRTLIAGARYHRAQLGALLAILLERRSEQDPVRRALFQALGDLPPTRWQADQLPALSTIVRHGLDDVGLSGNTLRFMLRLVLRIAPFQTAWASAQLATIVAERGFVAPDYAATNLPTSTCETVLTALQPIAYRWLAQGKRAETLQLVAYFAGALPEAGVALLTAVLDTVTDAAQAEQSLRLLRRAHPRQFSALVAALLAADASWIACPSVAEQALRRRQDLLAPYLAGAPLVGRFGTDRRRFLLPIAAPASGLTTRQQTTYAATLDAIIADPEQDNGARMQAIRMLAWLPGISIARLQTLADHPNTLIRTTALFALGRADTPDGQVTVLAALQDSRARIAILVAQRYLRAMPAADALAILRSVPLSRVTVAKSVARLLDTLPDAAGFRDLLALTGGDLHRDALAVVLEQLWHHPQRPEVWPVMAALLGSASKDLQLAALPPAKLLQAADVLRRTVDGTALTVHAMALDQLQHGLDHPQPETASAAVQRCGAVALPDDQHIVVPRLLARVRAAPRRDVPAPAAGLFKLCTAADAAAVAGVITARQSERHVLDALLDALAKAASQHVARLAPVCRAVLAGLAGDPVLVAARGTLAFRTLPASEFLAFLVEVAEADRLHADALVMFSNLITTNANRYTEGERERLRRDLAARAAPVLRRLSFACLLALTRHGRDAWTPERVAALQALRADPSPLVAGAAQFHFVEAVDEKPG